MSTLKDSVLCAMNVGKHSSTNIHLWITRESTLVKGFMHMASMTNLLGKPQPSINIEEFILGQGSTSATNVANSLTKNMYLFIPGEVTLEKIVTCAVNVCNLLAIDPSLFDNGQFTLEKGVMSALNVGNPLDENFT